MAYAFSVKNKKQKIIRDFRTSGLKYSYCLFILSSLHRTDIDLSRTLGAQCSGLFRKFHICDHCICEIPPNLPVCKIARSMIVIWVENGFCVIDQYERWIWNLDILNRFISDLQQNKNQFLFFYSKNKSRPTLYMSLALKVIAQTRARL